MTETEKKEPAAPIVVEAPATPAPAPQIVPTPIVIQDKDEPARSTRDVLLIIAAIGAVVVNVVAVAGGVYMNAKIEAAKEQSKAQATNADEKLDVIHEQTNSNLTGVNDRLDKAYTKIESLEKLLSEEESENKEKDP